MGTVQEEGGTAPPMPDVETEDGDQPEEEEHGPPHDLQVAVRERAVNSLENLVDGSFGIRSRTYVPRHTMEDCQFDPDCRQPSIAPSLIMRPALFCYPKHQPRVRDAATASGAAQPTREASGSMDVDETGSAASSGGSTSTWRRDNIKRSDTHPVRHSAQLRLRRGQHEMEPPWLRIRDSKHGPRKQRQSC